MLYFCLVFVSILLVVGCIVYAKFWKNYLQTKLFSPIIKSNNYKFEKTVNILIGIIALLAYFSDNISVFFIFNL